MRTITELEADLKYYREIYKRAKAERRFRTVDGAQWNIDRTMDEIYKLKEKR